MKQNRYRLYWGDLHNHNEIGYGRGTMDRSYRIAQASLDFYAFTPHGWWPDIPDSNTVVRQYHLDGFAHVRDKWSQIQDIANQTNQTGDFVALVAFEWHSSAWGDYCVYFPDGVGELFYAATLNELKSFANSRQALLIPHHCAYPQRGTNWDTFDPTTSPVAEIFSEHGNSLEPSSHFGMYRHSMGGTQYSRCISSQLAKGRKIGFLAGTDDHYGYPGSYGEGLTGLWTENLSRETVLKAIGGRHTYAVTGDRIKIWFQMGTGMMGDILPRITPREVSIEVEAQDEIDYVELIKNGQSCQKWVPWTTIDSNETITFRLEWGWGGMTAQDKTGWEMALTTENCRFADITPLFCGGPDLIGLQNRLELFSEQRATIQSFTCRSNFLPTQAAVISMDGTDNAALNLSVAGEWGEHSFDHTVRLTQDQLRADDFYLPVAEAFAAPLVKVHRCLQPEKIRFHKEWVDSGVGGLDYYYVKVLQKNGQMAWTSPIWFV